MRIFHSFLSDSLHSNIFKYNALIVTSANSQLITLTGLRFTNAAEVKRHKLLPWTFALSGVKGHLGLFQLNMLTYPLIVYSAALCEALPPLMSPLSKWHRAQSSATDLVLALPACDGTPAVKLVVPSRILCCHQSLHACESQSNWRFAECFTLVLGPVLF